MNERIKELLEQAGVKFVVMPKDTEYEKFAELIIKSCATVGDFAHRGGVVEPGVMIKEYFGVAE